MGVLAELGRLAITAWSPGGSGAGYIAAASYAGSVDSSFSSSAVLEILSVDTHRSKLHPTAQTQSSEKFCSLHWGNPSRTHPAGLIAGGLANGAIAVWDAAPLLRKTHKTSDDKLGLLYTSPTDAPYHNSAVRDLAFNPFINSRLASGSADGQVLIWDLANPSEPVTPRHPSAKSSQPLSAQKDPVTAVAWNRKVHNILSTASASGVMNVWDLKQNRQVISIRNPRGRLNCSSLSWHPDIATQIVITCDEDDSTAALLWDLRNATSPVNTFSHHSPKGVSSSSWSTHDSDLLLTSSKDSRTVVVSVSTAEVVVDSPQANDWNFDVKWSPRVPGLYVASSNDGRISVNSILVSSTAPSVSSETANALAESFGATVGDFQSGTSTQSPRNTDAQRVLYSVSRPPKWLVRQSSVSFAFGGRFSSCSPKDSSKVALDTLSESFPSPAESLTVMDASLLDMTSDDPSTALTWCKERRDAAKTPKDQTAWDILSILFQTDSRRKLVEYLGFKPPAKDEGDDIAMPIYGLLKSHPIAVPVRPVSPSPEVPHSPAVAEQADMATNGLASVNLDGPAPWDISSSPTNDTLNQSVLDGDDADAANDDESNKSSVKSKLKHQNGEDLSGKTSTEIEELIKNSVIVGNFRKAVDACLHVGRTADALIIAHAGGPDLWFHTQAEYLSKTSLSSSTSIVGAIAGPKGKLDDYVSHAGDSADNSWKEALAVLLTYCPTEELSTQCCALGNRLLSKNPTGALACFLCSGNSRSITSCWTPSDVEKGKSTAAMFQERIKTMSELVEKIRLVTAALLLAQGDREIGTVRALDEVSGSILCEFGAILVVQGDSSLAITYLSNLDPSYSCIYGSVADLNALATESLAVADSEATSHFERNTPVTAVTQGQLSSTYGGMNVTPSVPAWTPQGVDSTYGVGPPPPPAPANLYAQVPSPPPPTAMNVYSQATSPPPPVPFQTVQPPAVYGQPPAPYMPPAPVQPAVPTPVVAPHMAGGALPPGGAARPGLDPSSAYPDAPPAMMPPSATVPPPAATTNPPHVMGDPSRVQPPPVPPAQPPMYNAPGNVGTSLVDAPASNGMYAMPNAPVFLGGGGAGTSASLPAQPPPPPPPPTDGGMPAPTSYHASAKRGHGATLPPSSEVAVAKTRQAKAVSSSGMPKRSTSTSSSLSALSSEVVYLEKMDLSKMGGAELVVVKALRGALAQARSLNKSMMYKKKLDEINKRLGRLGSGLNAGLVDKGIVEMLTKFAKAMEERNLAEANGTVAALTREHWDATRQWIQGLKWLVECMASGR